MDCYSPICAENGHRDERLTETNRAAFFLRSLDMQSVEQQAVADVHASRDRTDRLAVGNARITLFPINRGTRTAQDLAITLRSPQACHSAIDERLSFLASHRCNHAEHDQIRGK